MSNHELIQDLVELSQKLASELHESKKEENRLRSLICDIFPFELYEISKVNHLNAHEAHIYYSISSILRNISDGKIPSPREKILEIQRLNTTNAMRYARDVFGRAMNPEQSNVSFAKTSGSTQNLNSNLAHEHARKYTIMHLKSDSVITWIPKNACSSIRYSVALDNGAIGGDKDIMWIHGNNQSFNASNKELLRAKNSFVILRNPYKRLLSFFLDKICHVDISGCDKSYEQAKKTFKTSTETTFEEFVETIFNNPSLIDKDIHTKRQCDFMIYNKYSKYYSVENFRSARDSIKQEIGLEIKDTRDINSIYTTKGTEKCDQISHQTSAKNINELMTKKKSPIPLNMYTKRMIGMTSALYLSDVILYQTHAPNSNNELRDWMHELSGIII